MADLIIMKDFMAIIKKYYYQTFALVLLSIIALSAKAGEYHPTFKNEESTTFGAFTDNVMEPIEIVRHLFNAASIILGLFLMINAIQNYFKHKKSPHEATLSSVIIGFILGIVFMLLPFTYELAKAGNQQLGLW